MQRATLILLLCCSPLVAGAQTVLIGGRPAACLGSASAHGGSVVAGAPTVLIQGSPAARLNDMHVCPMVTPGVPPIPHVGGPITGPGVPTVLIVGLPAAVIGDMATCVGPPDSIVGGCSAAFAADGAATAALPASAEGPSVASSEPEATARAPSSR